MNERLQRLVTHTATLRQQWRLMCCATLINVCVTAPVYVFGLVDTSHLHTAPPLWFNGFHLIASPWIYGARFKAAQQHNSRLINCCLIAAFAIAICTGISISSLFLSTTAFIIFYGLIGGVSSCFIMAMTCNLIHSSLDNPILLNFTFSTGHAMCQLILAPIYSALGTRINSLYLLLAVVSLLITPFFVILSRWSTYGGDPLSIADEIDFYSNAGREEASRYIEPPALQHFNVSLPADLIDMRKKQEPRDAESDQPEHPDSEYKLMTSEGVEVMDIIYEESEPESLDTIGSPSIDQRNDAENDTKALENAYEEINRKYSNLRTSRLPVKTFRKAKRWTSHNLTRIKGTAFRQVINPLRRASKLFKFYPSVLVKTFDAYSYILFVTTLPRLAAPPTTVFLAVGLPWLSVCFATLLLTETRLKSWQHHLSISAMALKFFGYYILYAVETSALIFGACILVSTSQAIQFLTLDVVIRSLFSNKRWTYTRGCIYSCSGLLLVLCGLVTEFAAPLLDVSDIYYYFILTPHVLSSGLWIFYQLYYRLSQFYEDYLTLG